MTVTASTRLGITRWSAGTDPFTRAQMDASFATLDNLVAIDMQGLLSARPAAAVRGRYYWATDGAGTLYRDSGAAWTAVGQVLYGSPVASAVGDTATDGVSTSVARADHRHAREAFGAVTAYASAQASSNGAATTVARSDHAHGFPTLGGTPSTVTPGDIAATGSGAVAFSNHTHASLPWATGSTAETGWGAAAAAGVAATYSRGDHTHGTPTTPVTTLATTGASTVNAATGAVTLTTPAWATATPAANPFGGAGTVGTTATGMARGDHVHPMATPVTSLTTNTGLSVNAAATGAVTITNTGVISVTTNTGLSANASATGAVTITNTGVTGAVAGTGIGVSGATGSVTITNTGVTSIVAGTNITVSGATGAVTVNGPAQATTVAAETSFGLAASAGVAATYSRGDHTHGTPAAPPTTKTVRIPHNFVVPGDVLVQSGDNYYIPPIIMSVPSGQTVTASLARFRLNSGTSATVTIQKRSIGGTVTALATGVVVSTTQSGVALTGGTFADEDRLEVIVTAVSGAPKNMTVTVYVDNAV